MINWAGCITIYLINVSRSGPKSVFLPSLMCSPAPCCIYSIRYYIIFVCNPKFQPMKKLLLNVLIWKLYLCPPSQQTNKHTQTLKYSCKTCTIFSMQYHIWNWLNLFSLCAWYRLYKYLSFVLVNEYLMSIQSAPNHVYHLANISIILQLKLVLFLSIMYV